jgi:hypothetical protein
MQQAQKVQLTVLDLLAEISQFVAGDSGKAFDSLICDLFAYQYDHNLPYRRLCEAVEKTPANVSSWTDIPAVPARAFVSYDLTCTPIEQAAAVFHSSGTTTGSSSKHWMSASSLKLYELSLKTFFKEICPQDYSIWAVMPSSEEAPRSSLSYMLQSLSASGFVTSDLLSFAYNLRDAASGGEPLTVFGTAFGFVELLDLMKFPLPAGSIVIETGGFKGRTREMTRADFYGLLRDGFEVSDSQCFSEYGMCEMASQFYSHGVQGKLYGPHWTRTIIIDPITGLEADIGLPGLARHFDLANFNSVTALQTQDLAVMDTDGGFRLIGRASDAELRGCSLTAEELWSR